MAITKLLYIGEDAKSPGKHLNAAIQYIIRPDKTGGEQYVGARGCDARNAYEDMIETKRIFGKEGRRQGYHIVISFKEGEISPGTANSFMDRFATEYLHDEYECVYAVHSDTDHVHGHLIFNSVNKITGKKYRYEKGDWENQIQPLTDKLCKEFGLEVLVYDKKDREGKRAYTCWGEKEGKRNTWSDMIRRDVDAAILISTDLEGFIKVLSDRGYEIKQQKYISVRPPGMQRFRRLSTLGSEYTTERLTERIVMENLITEARGAPKILRVRIPYHLKRTKLSGLQRKYFKRLYETGKLRKRPYSQVWKYREQIKEFHKLQEDYLFLARYEIQTYEKLVEVRDRLMDSYKKAGRDEQKNYRSKRKYRDLFQAAERMDYLSYAKEAYEDGDKEFIDEYEEYKQNEKKLSDSGYSMNEVLDLKTHFNSLYRTSREERFEIRGMFRTANRILNEVTNQTDTIVTKDRRISWKKEHLQ